VRIKVSERQLNEMSIVGDFGEFEVQVWCKETSDVPHVHVYSEASGLNACIRLDTPMYFPYDGHVDTLNASQRKEFNEFMHSPHRTGKFASNYEYAVFLWNDNNSSHEIELKRDAAEQVIIPDYSEIVKYEPNRS